jgi:hypothetical protein
VQATKDKGLWRKQKRGFGSVSWFFYFKSRIFTGTIGVQQQIESLKFNSGTAHMEQIVIIGNGIAGITAARHIRKNSDAAIRLFLPRALISFLEQRLCTSIWGI